MKADYWADIEIKIVGARHRAASIAMTATAARIRRRDKIMNAGIGITIVLTVNVIETNRMNTNGTVRRIGDEVGHGIDLDRAPHDQTENIISVTIGHTAQPDPSRPQAQTAMDTIALHRERLEIEPHVGLQPMAMRMKKTEPRLQAQTLIP